MNIPASIAATLGIGFVLGLRHALDTDHIVAVGTLVARERSFWRSTQIGAIWGLGHTVTLFAMGLLIIGFGLSIPENVGHWLELSVAAMLILLGARTLWLWKRGEGHICAHEHNGHRHVHFHKYGQHPCADAPPTPSGQGRHSQSFLVGMVHGLSGSAELMLLVLATIHQPLWALVFIAIFGVGMMVAMFALTAIFARLLTFTARFQNGWAYVDSGLRVFSGVASVAFGSFLLWQSYRG
ncbi:hypothetical protein EON83_06395 [bacterium]|nr:MAG: hypothetical protein EON83_06395 [bacterium]